MTINGIIFNDETPIELAEILQDCIRKGIKVTIKYGNPKTGDTWDNALYRNGYIQVRNAHPYIVTSRSKYHRKVKGMYMLDHCIFELSVSKSKRVLYQHKHQ